jgi:hypothetical protein
LNAVLESLGECEVRGKRTDPASFAKELSHISQHGCHSEADVHAKACACEGYEHSHSSTHEEHHFASCEIPLPEIVRKKRL